LLRGRKHLPEEDVAFLEDIVAETHHMTRLANSMLTLARLDAGARHREFEVVNLDDLVSATVRRISAFAGEKNVTVLAETGHETVVIGDPLLLEQVVFALLDNAVKYNRSGGQVVVRSAVEDEYALIEVRDTGIGIAEEHLSHLGERFYRVDKARSREAGGTGLGLSIARSIAEEHNGILKMTSVPDQGTTVTLRLPRARRK
jgi:signal transduction histidine kinase